jgi:uncharacterized protein YlxP (DUF503 family)
MVIGVCRLSLFIPGSLSLKDRRRAIKSLKQKLRNEFNLSVAEVDDEDLWQRTTLGMAVVSNDGRFADQVLAKAVDLIRQQADVELIDYQTEIR